MSLQFVVGPAGSGKSTYLYKWVVDEAVKNPKETYLVVVPEQFTMHTQQQLVKIHPTHSIMNIDILSFERMAYRVFDELGTDTLEVLEETGKHLLLRKVAQEKQQSLKVLRQNIKRGGYLAQMKSLISEFMQYDVSPEVLKEMTQHPSMSLSFQKKMSDVHMLYQAYVKRLEGHYITGEEVLQKLMDVADQSHILQGAVVVFDGFTGFTPVQNQFLQKLLTLAKKVVVTVTDEPDEALYRCASEDELFAMSKEMIMRLFEMAKREHIPVEEPILLLRKTKGRFAQGGCLAHLEKEIFRPQSRAYEGKQPPEDGLEMVSLSNPRQELRYVACEIEKQIRQEGMRYRDFAVICADMEEYSHLVPEVFDRAKIPYFLDIKSKLEFWHFVESIKSLFMIAEDNFSYESVLRLLRTGMTDLTVEEIDLLENYILAANIRGKSRYQENFLFMPSGYTGEQMVRINTIREQFYQPIGRFMEEFPGRRGTVQKISAALYRWITHYEMEEKLYIKQAEYEQQQKETKAQACGQLYGSVMGLLDKLVSILGQEEMSLEEYAELLDTGLESVGIGVIPPANDVVMIGDIERTRFSDVQVLYLVGAKDGAIPKSESHGGILSQMERQQLKEAQFTLAPTDRERVFMQRFYLYLVMTKPTKKLVVTYARVDNAGKATRRSYLFGVLEKLFPLLSVQWVEELSPWNQLMTPEMGEDYLVNGLREYVAEGSTKDEWLAFLWWEQQHRSEKMRRWLEAAYFVHQEETLSAAVVQAVFGEQLTESVSRLEQYARCAYSYFLRYGLDLQSREEYSFANTDMGTLYHTALDEYAKGLQRQSDVNWYTVTKEQMRELLQEAIRRTYQTVKKTQVFSEARELYVLHRMEQTLEQTIWALTEQVRRGSFVPEQFEVDFGEVQDLKSMHIQLDEMHTMKLRGKIDRVDLCKKENSVYVKIIDYKSGQKDLDFDLLYHGLQVQLVLYLSATMEGMKKKYPDKQIEPGAMFYYHIHRPFVERNAGDVSAKEEAILKELRMKGVVNKDPQVLEAMDHGLSGKSHVIPVGIKKDGTPDATSKVLSSEEFQVMEDYVQLWMRQTGESIKRGKIDCVPYKMGQKDGCMYCEYQGICGFDSKMEGYTYRTLHEQKDRDDIITAMKEDLKRAESKEKGNTKL